MNDPAAYARQIEGYLCQKNGGHLIRVVGPAFDLVRSWAAAGVPLKVAFQGIDRCCARYEKQAARRRPIRLEFCEADVVDAFDAWRRAVGATAAADAEPAAPRRPALAAHVDRAIARLAHVRGVGPAASGLHHRVEQLIRDLEALAASASGARGEKRADLVARLAELDADMMSATIRELDSSRADALRREAAEELAPFRARMPEDARQRAIDAAFTRLVRENAGLPTLAYE